MINFDTRMDASNTTKSVLQYLYNIAVALRMLGLDWVSSEL